MIIQESNKENSPIDESYKGEGQRRSCTNEHRKILYFPMCKKSEGTVCLRFLNWRFNLLRIQYFISFCLKTFNNLFKSVFRPGPIMQSVFNTSMIIVKFEKFYSGPNVVSTSWMTLYVVKLIKVTRNVFRLEFNTFFPINTATFKNTINIMTLKRRRSCCESHSASV